MTDNERRNIFAATNNVKRVKPKNLRTRRK